MGNVKVRTKGNETVVRMSEDDISIYFARVDGENAMGLLCSEKMRETLVGKAFTGIMLRLQDHEFLVEMAYFHDWVKSHDGIKVDHDPDTKEAGILRKIHGQLQ